MKKPLFFLLLFFTCGCGVRENADLILLNGNVITLDSSDSRVEALAIRNGRIIATGSNLDIRSRYASMRAEDLEGSTVLPGFTDSHIHMLSLGRFLERLSLKETRSYTDVLDSVRQRAAVTPKNRWIHGRGWDQNLWPDKNFPSNETLNAVSRDHYVLLKRVDGHAVLVNDNVLNLAGISPKTPDPPGGKILRDAHGKPTGVLIDNAADMIIPFIPTATANENRESLRLAFNHCLENGITSVHDAGIDSANLAIYHDLGRKKQLPLRIYAMLEYSDRALVGRFLDEGPALGLYDGFLTVRSVKLYADGALGSRGAALLEAYSDDTQSRGLIVTPHDDLSGIAKRSLDRGFQLCTHAIGDSGNRFILTVYEFVLSGAKLDFDSVRWRIEHAQVIHPDDFKRFGSSGIIASVQPTHCTSDMVWAEQRLGPERVKGAYAWRSLIESGARLCLGSDAPVESCSPLWGIYSAVTRQDHAGNPARGWYADQIMSIHEAVRGYTVNSAYAAFEDHMKGTIEKGKFADLVVLSDDITKIRPSEILTAKIRMTLVNGKVMYRKKSGT